MDPPTASSEGLQRAPMPDRQRFGSPIPAGDILPTQAEGEFTERIPDGPFMHFDFTYLSSGCDNEALRPMTAPDGTIMMMGSIVDRIAHIGGRFPDQRGGQCALDFGCAPCGNRSRGGAWYNDFASWFVTLEPITDATVEGALELGRSGLTISAFLEPHITTDPRIETQRFYQGMFLGKTDAWGLFLEDGNWIFRLNIEAESSCAGEISMPALGSFETGYVWQRVTATYDGQTMRLYMDGTEMASLEIAGTINDSDGPLLLGGNPGGEFSARIDDIVLYRRALTSAEVAILPPEPWPNDYWLYPGYPN